MIDKDDTLDRLIALAESVAAGNHADVDKLMVMADAQSGKSKVTALAEAFGMLVVQVEAREFQLSCTIGDLERTLAELEHANFDALTGLPNRAIFQDRLRKTVTAAKTYNHQMAVMFIDLDHFKWVNDNLGHDAGDELLRIVASRIAGCVRADDIVARIGGDEFTVILPIVSDGGDATDIAERIIAALARPIVLQAGEARVGASIGIAMLASHAADTPEALLKKADTAMYLAKENGRNTFKIYSA
jgi:diguanylate cyclase (GGDEF)-like protein